MIKVLTLADDLALMRMYYAAGFQWIYAATYEAYRNSKMCSFREYYLWDLRSLETHAEQTVIFEKITYLGSKYIMTNDMWLITSQEYLPRLRADFRARKLTRILG